MLERGAVIKQRYRIVRSIGQGGFGAVYRAWDIALKRPIALKENLDVSSEAQRQFEREATTLANLHHPHLPRVTDHFILPEQGQYLVMDFIEGEDLEQIITQQGQISEAQALAWIRPIADALDYLHNLPEPVIHRDVKPANIIIGSDNTPFLVDFGLVKVSSQHIKTTVGARSITPGYAPPEQYGSGGTDARTDLYALAATLYSLLTGIRPPESVQRFANDTLQPAHLVNPQVSPAVSLAISKGMALIPAERFQRVTAFKHALTTLPPVGETTIHLSNPQPQTVPPVAPVPQKRNNRFALLGGIAALILLIGSFVFYLPRFIEGQRGEAVAEVEATLTRSAEDANVEATETAEFEIEVTNTAIAAETETALQLTGDVSDIETATAVAAVTEGAIAAESTLAAATQAAETQIAQEATEAALALADADAATATTVVQLTSTAVAIAEGGTAEAATATQNALAAETTAAQNAIATQNAQSANATRNAQNAIAATRTAQANAAATQNARNAAATWQAQNATATRNAQNAQATRNAQNARATQTAQAQVAAAWNATSTASAVQTQQAIPTATPQRGILNGRWGGSSNDNQNSRAWEEFWTLTHAGGDEFSGTISYRGSDAPASSSDSFAIFGFIDGTTFAFLADDEILYVGEVATIGGRQNLSGTMFFCEDKNGDGDVTTDECDPVGTFELWRL